MSVTDSSLDTDLVSDLQRNSGKLARPEPRQENAAKPCRERSRPHRKGSGIVQKMLGANCHKTFPQSSTMLNAKVKSSIKHRTPFAISIRPNTSGSSAPASSRIPSHNICMSNCSSSSSRNEGNRARLVTNKHCWNKPAYGRNACSEQELFMHGKIIQKFNIIFDPLISKVDLATPPDMLVDLRRQDCSSTLPAQEMVEQLNASRQALYTQRHRVVWSAHPDLRNGVKHSWNKEGQLCRRSLSSTHLPLSQRMHVLFSADTTKQESDVEHMANVCQSQSSVTSELSSLIKETGSPPNGRSGFKRVQVTLQPDACRNPPPPSELCRVNDIIPSEMVVARPPKSVNKVNASKRPKTAPATYELSQRSVPVPRRTVVGILAEMANRTAGTRAMLNESKALQAIVKSLVPLDQLLDPESDDW